MDRFHFFDNQRNPGFSQILSRMWHLQCQRALFAKVPADHSICGEARRNIATAASRRSTSDHYGETPQPHPLATELLNQYHRWIDTQFPHRVELFLDECSLTTDKQFP